MKSQRQFATTYDDHSSLSESLYEFAGIRNNQALHKLTALGQTKYADGDDAGKAEFSSLDIMFDDESTLWIAGIPRRGDLNNLLDLLASQNIQAGSTEQTLRRRDTCKT